MIKEVGKITHYFTNIGVAVIELSDNLTVGDRIRIKGSTTDFEQDVTSMQIDRADVKSAQKNQSVGLKVEDRVREGDKVFVVS